MSEPTTARGKAPILTDADLEAMAEVSPEDIDETNAFWKRNAREDFKDILDSEPDEGEGDE